MNDRSDCFAVMIESRRHGWKIELKDKLKCGEEIIIRYSTTPPIGASSDWFLVGVKGGKVVQGRKEGNNIIFKPDCPGHYNLYWKNNFIRKIKG